MLEVGILKLKHMRWLKKWGKMLEILAICTFKRDMVPNKQCVAVLAVYLSQLVGPKLEKEMPNQVKFLFKLETVVLNQAVLVVTSTSLLETSTPSPDRMWKTIQVVGSI